MTSAAKLRRDEIRKDNIPEIILDPSSGKRYLKGRFLGKVKLSETLVSHKPVMISCVFMFSKLRAFLENTILLSFILGFVTWSHFKMAVCNMFKRVQCATNE